MRTGVCETAPSSKSAEPNCGDLTANQNVGTPDWSDSNCLMVQDGIDLALSLVQVTVDMQRFSFGAEGSPGSVPGIGGSVDVLVQSEKDFRS